MRGEEGVWVGGDDDITMGGREKERERERCGGV